MTVTLVQIGLGLFLLVVGGRLLIVGVVDFAQTLGVPQAIIGLKLVAVGTSLPELVTSLVATLRGQGDIVIGCVVGSNVFNVLGILGTTALVVPLEPEVISLLDLWLMVGLSLALGLLLLWRPQLGRPAGAVLLATYVGYVGWLAMF